MSDNELLLAISQMLDEKLDKKLDEKLKPIQDEIKKVKINQENDIMPRVRTIEACYTSTYDRYAQGVNEIESLIEDVKLLKKVVTEHSKKLQKIS